MENKERGGKKMKVRAHDKIKRKRTKKLSRWGGEKGGRDSE